MREHHDAEVRPPTRKTEGRPTGDPGATAAPSRDWMALAFACIILIAQIVVLASCAAPSEGTTASQPERASSPAPTAEQSPQPATPEVGEGGALELMPRPTPAEQGAEATPEPVQVTGQVANWAPPPERKAGTADPNPSTWHVVVVDGDSGAILFERNAFEPIAPASLTKIMTALLAIEQGNLADKVKVDVDARTMVDSTVMGLEPWFDVTLEDLLYGIMLPSGNDAALAIGRHVAGSDAAFARMMNDKASWLGLYATQFQNPHGLDEPGHYSCPYDMAMMARHAMQYPEFRKLAAARSYDVRGSNIGYTIYNLNPILNSYPGADGVKVGYTDDAGRSIVASAMRDGRRVYVAFMRSEAGLVADTTLLLDWAFGSFAWPDVARDVEP